MVTGGNAGIGLALCRQLALAVGCHVIMTCRNEERGRASMLEIDREIRNKEEEEMAGAGAGAGAGLGLGGVDLVIMDVGDDASVRAAAGAIRDLLATRGATLYAIVNNAGVGPNQASPDEIINTNLRGVKRVVDSLLPLLDESCGRIVNVGSGSGPVYVGKCPPATQALLCREPESWEQIISWVAQSSDGTTGLGSPADGNSGYGLSKALLSSYTMLLARQNPSIKVNCCTPGFIQTKLTAGWGASKTPEEGTSSIHKLLFDELEGNGRYYGSDGVPSPYHFMRNPGDPQYDGVPPY